MGGVTITGPRCSCQVLKMPVIVGKSKNVLCFWKGINNYNHFVKFMTIRMSPLINITDFYKNRMYKKIQAQNRLSLRIIRLKFHHNLEFLLYLSFSTVWRWTFSLLIQHFLFCSTSLFLMIKWDHNSLIFRPRYTLIFKNLGVKAETFRNTEAQWKMIYSYKKLCILLYYSFQLII